MSATQAEPPPGTPPAELRPVDRFEWERLVRRIEMPKPVKLLALIMGTFADADGTRVRPGNEVLGAVTGDSEKNVRRLVRVLRHEYGLLELVSRGGGRYGKGRTSEYRLTVPVDLLDRFEMLDPDYNRTSRLTGHPDVRSERAEPPVDNADSPDIQVSAQSEPAEFYERTSGDPPDSMSGHFEVYERTSGCPTTKDQPPTTPTTRWLSTTVTPPTRGRPVDKRSGARRRPTGSRRPASSRPPSPARSRRRPARRVPERARRRRSSRIAAWLRSAMLRAGRRRHRGDPPGSPARSVAP